MTYTLPPTTRRNRRRHTRARAIAGLALRAAGLALIAAAAVHATKCTATEHDARRANATAACLAYAQDPDAADLGPNDYRLAEPHAQAAVRATWSRHWQTLIADARRAEASVRCYDFAAGRTRWVDEQDLANASPEARAAAQAHLD